LVAKKLIAIFAQILQSMKTEKQIAAAAAEFAERWKGRGYERGESQPFWIDLLTNVFGIETMTESQCVAELFKLYQELTKN
jgi:hypothetical protein